MDIPEQPTPSRQMMSAISTARVRELMRKHAAYLRGEKLLTEKDFIAALRDIGMDVKE